MGIAVVQGIDVCDAASIESLRQTLGDTSIDLLLHNSGILTNESLQDMDFERIEEQFRVNTLGPLRVIHALLGNLNAGSKIGILSSRMGSLADNGSGGRYGYRISKAGLNALGISLARDLADSDIAVALLHPGLVATDMTGRSGIPVEDAARGLIEQMEKLNMQNTGSFWHAEGYELPW
jgi:NAD(P)-dependent dehydrogenase (short-subunit alcohol dehydrogenase family)